MITKLFLLTALSLMVSSQNHGSYGDPESSSKLHTKFPSENVSFIEIGQYSGEVNDWKYKKSYYVSKSFKANWDVAKAICRSFDLELATFETLEEFQNFEKILESTNPFSDIAHVDGITTKLGSFSDWYWTNSGAKIPYSLLWNPTQPDNGKGSEEACLSLQKFQGKYGFNDYFCSKQATVFICQKTQLFHGCF
ncbi:unnamed protein product [Chironomus riparius]|uniref:C-type lectin domain-containing protein n=1 Tax=Chironomus riparius TaxID=315576 RepID=A0A9N9S3H9_9DIPT|nr:unnamed protein product [Chironomus riparius]